MSREKQNKDVPAVSFMSSLHYTEEVAKEAGHRALNKAKRLEKARIKEGWRYVKVSDRRWLFVPCDKDGQPTEKGKKMISAIATL